MNDSQSSDVSAKYSQTAGRNLAELIDLTALPGVPCPCGIARRALADRADFPGTLHLTSISSDAQTHYHREHTEVYVVLSCEADAQMELDGQLHALRPKMTVVIPPNVRHRASGTMEVLIISLPNFDPADEHFDD